MRVCTLLHLPSRCLDTVQKPVPCSRGRGLLTGLLYPGEPRLWEAVTQAARPFNLRSFLVIPVELIESVTGQI